MKNENKSLDEISEDIRKQTAELQDLLNNIQDVNNNVLSKNEKHILNYFWNNKRKEIFNALPESVILFFENQNYHQKTSIQTRLNIQRTMINLMNKDFIKKNTDFIRKNDFQYELSEKGKVYLTQQHPIWRNTLEILNQKIPFFVKFLLGLIGFISSVFGIIQFLK